MVEEGIVSTVIVAVGVGSVFEGVMNGKENGNGEETGYEGFGEGGAMPSKEEVGAVGAAEVFNHGGCGGGGIVLLFYYFIIIVSAARRVDDNYCVNPMIFKYC